MTHSLCVFSGLDGDAGQNGCAGVTPARVYDTICANLQEFGFFDVRVNVESSNERFAVEINLMAYVESFKSVLEPMFEIPAARQCLLSQGRILEDGQTLLSYGRHCLSDCSGGPTTKSAS
ncbi:uncharacterized protein [Rutidosis leptorrhynchoides]|uniref:uncharacterized protein n=1 Tax=Rutidosis leptorrhynchoides TaxID=125765 RepID=UPI003A9A076A